MEDKSSLAADLFGAKESPPSAAGIFASIFPPPSTILGRNSSRSKFPGSLQKQASGNHLWSTTYGTSAAGNLAKNATLSEMNAEKRSVFQERVEPCPLSSSLYNGGQEDMYIKSSDQISRSCPKFKIDAEQDDRDGNHFQGASRGNWWEGSLYY